MSTDRLPNGWTRVKFGDVVSNVNENSRDLDADGIDRVVGLDHLDPGSLSLVRWDNLAELPDGTTFTRKFKPGQVLFGKRRAYQRKVAVPDFEGVCSGDILVFEPADKRMLTEFLPFLVQSDGFFDHALGTSAGSLSPRTKWAELAKYEFALPPIDEQRDLANRLRTVDRVIQSLSCLDVESLKNAFVVAALKSATQECLVSDVLSFEYGKGLSESSRDGGQFSVVGSAGVVGSHSVPLVEEDRTIVVGRKGTAGSVQLIGGPCWPIDTTYYVRLKVDIPLDFVYEQLKLLNLEALVAATAVPGLNREDAYKRCFRIPPPETIDRVIQVAASCIVVRNKIDEQLGSLRQVRAALLSSATGGHDVQ